MNPVELLKNNALFSELPLSCINKAVKTSRYHRSSKGELLFLEGETASGFYLLEEGKIRLFKSAGYDRETTIRIIEPKDVFAEVILFELDSYPVSAESMEDSKLLFFEKTGFIHLLDEENFRNNFCKMLMHKQRYLAERIKILSTLDIEERFILYLAKRYGIKSKYSVNTAKKDIALEIGTIPETFSRMIKRLQLKKILQWNGTTITADAEYIAQILEEIQPQ